MRVRPKRQTGIVRRKCNRTDVVQQQKRVQRWQLVGGQRLHNKQVFRLIRRGWYELSNWAKWGSHGRKTDQHWNKPYLSGN
ncbi:hypothetical protein GCM10011378_32700 [Hymenobacter glacieicola]|uniref:Group II intron maturase-specific domain-containing protein n=1 Tax=Hymenobacter glacieicola TaxID=1562124 RepID=A0ABQ1X3A1_9BACT|nr:hypothetical protein GCM10011378_32700 [Hymenobacter glacieicola]